MGMQTETESTLFENCPFYQSYLQFEYHTSIESTSRSNSEIPRHAKQYMLSSWPTGSHLILVTVLWIKCK